LLEDVTAARPIRLRSSSGRAAMSKTTEYGWVPAVEAKRLGAIRNPNLPQYKDRLIIYRDGPAERGHPRGRCTINDDPVAADWLVERLRIAERHEPWAGTMPASKKF
jgi:hypothetical protein